jgi:hypothetical protein
MKDEPVRLIDSSSAPPALREALRAARSQRPEPSDVDDIIRGVLSGLDAPPDPDGGDGGPEGDGGPSGDGATPDLPVDPATSGALAKAAAAALAGTIAVGAIVLSTRTSEDPASSPPSSTATPITTATKQAPMPSTRPPAPSATSTAAPPPSAEAPPEHPKAPAPSARATPPRSETVILGDAQKALATNPQATLRYCAEHAKHHPRGALSQEREVLTIEALVRLGRHAEARARADAFRASHPDSGHNRRLDALVK